MITCMCKIVCVTHRGLCGGDFLQRIEDIARCGVHSIILREKDMSEEDYFSLAKNVMAVCEKYGVRCTLHSFVGTAIKLKAKRIHLPLHVLREMSDEEKSAFETIGASCHSVQDTCEAIRLGASYITAGHIFDTDCKKGLAGRGLGFLTQVCESVDVPVYAIGGISRENIRSVINSGASGVCLMSSMMKTEDINEYIRTLKGEI